MIALDINCVKYMLEIIEGREIEKEVRENVARQLKIKIRNEDNRIRQAILKGNLSTIEKKSMRNFQKENSIIGDED